MSSLRKFGTRKRKCSPTAKRQKGVGEALTGKEESYPPIECQKKN